MYKEFVPARVQKCGFSFPGKVKEQINREVSQLKSQKIRWRIVMYKKTIYLICLVITLSAASSLRAEVAITTADGNGADTYIGNDVDSRPGQIHGDEDTISVRRNVDARIRIAWLRFDLTGIAGDLSSATLSLYDDDSAREREWTVYGMVDGADDFWDEATMNYNNAPGFLPADLGTWVMEEGKWEQLGTITITATPDTIFTSNPTDLNMDSFLAADTNKLVTLIIIWEGEDYGDAWYLPIAKENEEAVIHPTLTLPNAFWGSATQPDPANGADDVPRDGTSLSWRPGDTATSHDVYFGTDMNSVRDADLTNPLNVLLVQEYRTNSYALSRLELGQKYYWRVDAVSGGTIYKGSVWSFTAEPVGQPIAGENIIVKASSYESRKEPENIINNSGLDEDDLHSRAITTMWLSAEGQPGPTWLEFEFDIPYQLHQMWVWNFNGSLEPTNGYGFKDVKIEYSLDGTEYQTLGTTHVFNQAPGMPYYAHNTIIDFNSVTAKFVKLTANNNWGRSQNQYGLSEVRFFNIPLSARKPMPEDGATGIALDATLNWRAGRQAVEHNVYISTSKKAIVNSTSPDATETETIHGPLSLDLGTTYFWRIDEVNEAETLATWRGSIWDFTTQEYLVVEDFEDYNDTEPDTIYLTWVDGYDIPSNGSTAGYESPDFIGGGHYLEGTIVHGGGWSMPLLYDNSPGISEVTRTFSPRQDWTVKDVTTLSLWYYGDPNNDAERMYVALNGNAIVYNDEANAALITEWTQWDIDLQLFANQGVDLTNINSMTIGFGNKSNPQAGGSGTVLFDDIGLYPARCTLSRRSADFARLDYVEDCIIDYKELEIMAAEWLTSGSDLKADLNSDNMVDLKDYAVLADRWLEQQLWP
jgi:hypothetical protein